MILKTDLIKKFLNDSAVVKPNVLYPNLQDTIKIELKENTVTLIKCNYNIFCSYTVPYNEFQIEDECYLIGERSLAGIAQTTNSATITINQQNDLINIIGTKDERVQYPVRPLADFPALPIPTGNAVQMDMEALYCIKVAAAYISTDQKITACSFVHVGADGVFATNNDSMVYYRKFTGLPNAFFGIDALQVIKPAGDFMYSANESMDFFTYDGFTYGVLKNAALNKPFPYMHMVTAPAEFCFTVTRKKLLDFCMLAIYASKSTNPIGVLNYNGQELFISHDDADFNIHANRKFSCEINGSPCQPFKFPILGFDTFLKSLPYENMTFLRMGNHFKIGSPDDENYVGIYAGIN